MISRDELEPRLLLAEVLAENEAMLEVFRESGFQVESTFADESYHVVLAIEPTAAV